MKSSVVLASIKDYSRSKKSLLIEKALFSALAKSRRSLMRLRRTALLYSQEAVILASELIYCEIPSIARSFCSEFALSFSTRFSIPPEDALW